MAGPLDGIRIIELVGIGPGPFAGMMLADMGAEVIAVDRPGGNPTAAFSHTTLLRNRRHVAVNLRTPEGAQTVLRMVEQADAVFEGFRPGVAERLGVGPQDAMARNPKLVYGRMTGWGQEGPWATAAGHDLNYIALSGVLHAIGESGRKPVPPLNLVGDFGGGGMLLVYGMVCALLHAERTGEGQVVDAAMVDGASALMQMFFSMHANGAMYFERGVNLLDGGAPFYDTYETSDGQWISLGPIEPQFYSLLLDKLGLADDPLMANQLDMGRWGEMKARIAEVVGSRTREEWEEVLGGTDVCYAPVLTLQEAARHPHNVARGVHLEVDGVLQPAPAPRFSHSTPSTPTAKRAPGADSTDVLKALGFDSDEVRQLIADEVVVQE